MKVSDYLYRKASINKIPLNGVFELSPVCNFSCKMCYVRKDPEQIRKSGKRIIKWTEWISLAKECKAEGMLYLLLTGGEPFLYPNFKELYLELHKMGFLISINSNATMIDEETIIWLKEAAPHRINITLYGTSGDTYEKITGNRKGYERAVKAILMLQEAGIQVVINASMIPQNVSDLEEIIEFGKKHNIITRVSTYMFPPVRREQEETDSRFTPEEAGEIYLRKQKIILGEYDYKSWVREEMKKLQEQQKKRFEDKAWGNSPEYMQCRAGRCSFWVSWEGVMTACGMISFPVKTYPLKQPFRECWMEITKIVRTTEVLKGCNECTKKEMCKPCAAMLYSETGDVSQKSSYLCKMTEHIVEKMKSELQENN